MVFKCCVPNCRGNYKNSTKVTVFSFPRNEFFRQKWIKTIHRENYQPNCNSRVSIVILSINTIKLYTFVIPTPSITIIID